MRCLIMKSLVIDAAMLYTNIVQSVTHHTSQHSNFLKNAQHFIYNYLQ